MENNHEIKPKGLAEYLDENPSLKTKMTYGEFNSGVKMGVDDSEIEEAYKTCQKIMAETRVKPKGLAEYLDENPSLRTKMTYGEFNSGVKTGVDDSEIKEAYKTYRKVIDAQVKK